jgi:hypothetical protein
MAARDRFQVLSLDGGGIRGIFSAALLAGLEKDLDRPIIDHFDLVVGTSTGGLVAAALGAGIAMDEIVDLYVSERTTIFPGPRRLRAIRQLVRPKYRANGLHALLRQVFGRRLLGESRVPLVIPSYDLGENNVYLFKTPHHERLKRDWRVPLWQVTAATTAAPRFFRAFSLPDDHVRLVDGGVWASVGTTANPRTRKRKLDNGGLVQWGRGPNVVDVLLAGQSVGAFAQVRHLIPREHAYRLDPPAPAGVTGMDLADARDLKAKAAFHSRSFCPTFESTFADHIAGPYQPWYGPNATSG